MSSCNDQKLHIIFDLIISTHSKIYLLSCHLCFFGHNAGTDDDIPPSHQNRYANVGRASANGRSAVVGVASLGTAPFPPIHSDMEAQIHQIEQEAYSSVLRAFKAQSDAITWVCIWSFSACQCLLELPS